MFLFITRTEKVEIIRPPPDIRTIIDKTVEFVDKNGKSFEEKILSRQGGNTKFNFLKPGDPYHAYYQDKLKDSFESTKLPLLNPSILEKNKLKEKIVSTSNTKSSLNAHNLDTVTSKILEQPKIEDSILHIPGGLTMLELDIIKLTAQFTAKNGKALLTGLYQREQSNPLFSFIRPNNSLFPFFTNMVDKYQSIIDPSKEANDELAKDAECRENILNRCLMRLEFEKTLNRERIEVEKKIEKERIDMLSIDWHDFTVVDTIEYFDDEDDGLPNPMTLKDVVILKKSQQNKALLENNDITIGKSDKQESIVNKILSDDEKKPEESTTVSVSGKPTNSKLSDLDEVNLVRDYTRRQNVNSDSHQFVRSPLTNEIVAINDIAEHMRINLIDSRWRHQKTSMLDKLNETTKASDDEIAFNISNLAQHRPDIFAPKSNEKPPLHSTKLTKSNPLYTQTSSEYSNTIKKSSLQELSNQHDSLNNADTLSINRRETTVFSKQPQPDSNFENDYHVKKNKRKKNEMTTDSSSLMKSFGSQLVKVHCVIPKAKTFYEKFLELHIQSLEIKVASLKDRLMEITSLSTSKQKISIPGMGVLLDENYLSSYNIHPGTLLLLETNCS
jgi:splicing factor 3A subunit 1